jgi:Cu2+-exporting ATPase
MPIPLLLIAAGTSLSLYRVKKQSTKKIAIKNNKLIEESQNDANELTSVVEQQLSQRKQTVDHEFKYSLIAMGVTGVAQLVYSPLLVIGVPLVIYSSLPVIADAWRGLRNKQLRSTIIDSIAITGSILGHYYFTNALINTSYFLGQKILVQTEDHSNQKLQQLFSTQPRYVWLWVDGVELETPFEDVKQGQTVVIHAGEVIPFDGKVINGQASADQHMLTGESQPQDKDLGDDVFASTLLVSGKIHICVEKAGKDTVAAQIGEILQNTTDFKSNIEARAIQTANHLTLPTLALSGVALMTLGPMAAVAVTYCNFADIIRISLPLGVLNHLKVATDKGILIKDGRALELLGDVDTVVFDKTGTLTQEEPIVGKIHSCGTYTEDDILSLAATAEHRQTHPVARAILNAAKERGLSLVNIDQAHYEMGYGIKVSLKGQDIRVGSRRFMLMEGIEMPDSEELWRTASHEEGHSLVYLSVDNILIGVIELHIILRPEVSTLIKNLRQRNLALCIISGDHYQPTKNLADSLGITEFFAETLPEDKAKHIEALQAQGRKVCFIGDGINDAIAMKKAQVAISIAGATTVATDTANIILMNKDLKQLDELFKLSADFEQNIKSGMKWSLLPGAIGVMGVFFFHLRIYGASSLYLFSLVSGISNATLPLLKKKEVDEKKGLTLQQSDDEYVAK